MKNLLILFGLLLFVVSCTSDDEGMDPNTDPVAEPQMPMNTPVNATLKGLVYDENGTAIQGANVQLGSSSQITDQFGYFAFPSTTVNGSGALYTVNANGYHTAYELFNCKDGEALFLSTNMIPKTLTGSINSGTGGLISMSGGASITLQANSISNSIGSAYNGQVNVYAHWLNPIDYQDLLSMPGDLRAVNSNNEILQLATYGMMVVELESPTGEALNLISGRSAVLEFPLPISLTANAPSIIEFWTLNETTGYWEEDGTATLSNNSYRAEVGHFSWFNCDISFETVNLELCLTDQGVPLQDIIVTLSLNSNGRCGISKTNGGGFVSGIIPFNEVLTVGIYDPICNAEVFTQELGPFTSDGKESIDINFSSNPQVKVVNLSGTFLDCNGALINQGFVSTTAGTHHELNNGVLNNVSFVTCADQISVTAFDLVEFTSSTTQDYLINQNPTNINLGTVTVCDAIGEFITANINGQTYTFIENPTSITNWNNSTVLNAQLLNESADIRWGSIDLTGNVGGGGASFYLTNSFYYSNAPLMINVTEYGPNVGDFIKGTYEGTFLDEDNGVLPPITITGSFAIKRD